MDTPEIPQESPVDDMENQPPKPPEKQGRGRTAVLMVAVALAAVVLVVEHHYGTRRHLPPNSNENAASLRQELISRANGQTPAYTIYRLREGIERFLIQNINDPGATALTRSQQPRRRHWQDTPPSTTVSVSVTTQAAAPPPVPQYAPPAYSAVQPWNAYNTKQYDAIEDNDFQRVADKPVSTFSIDVDTASYANVRRMLRDGVRPPHDAVRIEELVNYFHYQYPVPEQGTPFSVNVEVASAPWQPAHRLVRIGLRGYKPPETERPACNLVFLVDVSGSMQANNKLPLVKRTLNYLLERLDARDYVALCAYSDAARQIVAPTPCDEKDLLRDAIARLEAGGCTNGGQGIQLAYSLAAQHQRRDAVNRVILATDGDFNAGVTDRGEIIESIKEQAGNGIFLTTLGFGMGNLKDGTLEQLADRCNGNYAYIDSFEEAQTAFGEKFLGTVETIAKDVKIQVEFNPVKVAGYRLIGYENRLLKTKDFNDDTKDAGEIGAGHTITALYEIVPAGCSVPAAEDPLRYQAPQERETTPEDSDELLYVKLRYKEPKGLCSKLLERPVADIGTSFEEATQDFRFAAAVATFGMVLRDSPYTGNVTFEEVCEWTRHAMEGDDNGERGEFLKLARTAASVMVASR